MNIKKEDLKEFVNLVEEYIEGIDEEMEHGCYSAPEDVPYEYDNEDEGDYYRNHRMIVDRNANLRFLINDMLGKFKSPKKRTKKI